MLANVRNAPRPEVTIIPIADVKAVNMQCCSPRESGTSENTSNRAN